MYICLIKLCAYKKNSTVQIHPNHTKLSALSNPVTAWHHYPLIFDILHSLQSIINRCFSFKSFKKIFEYMHLIFKKKSTYTFNF